MDNIEYYWDGVEWVAINAADAEKFGGKLPAEYVGANHLKDYTMQIPWGGVSTNVGNAYSIAEPEIAALTVGMAVCFQCNAASTGPSTLNWNGKSAKGIKKADGTDLTNLKLNGIYTVRYNGVNFQSLGEGGKYGNVTSDKVLDNVLFGTETGIAEGTIPINGPVSSEIINLTTEGSEYTIVAGHHSGLRKIKAVIAGLIASVVKKGSTVGGIAGTFTEDATATAAHMLQNMSAYVNGIKIIGNILSKVAAIYTPSNVDQTIASGQYLSGNQTILAVPVDATKVLAGTTIANTAGSMSNNAGDKNAVSSHAVSGALHVVPAKGYTDGVDDASVVTDANFVAANIPDTKIILGLQGTLAHVDINGTIASYTVISGGTTINAGDFVSYVNNGSLTLFKSGSVQDVSATQLDTNKVLVAYCDASTYYGCAVVLTISGSSISVGTTVVHQSNQSMNTSVCALSTTKAIVAYSGTSGYSVRAKVLTISGTTITAGSELTLRAEESCDYRYISITAIDSTRAVVAWQQNYYPSSMYQGHAMILSASSTTITASNVLTFDGSGGGYANVCKADTNKAVVVWGASGYVYAMVLQIGTGVTWGTNGSAIQWEGGPSNYSSFFSMAMLSAGKIIIAYGDGGVSKTKIFTVSGTSISFGTLYNFDNGCSSVTCVAITALNATTASVGYVYYSSADYYIVTKLSISGTVITNGTRTSLGSFSHNSAGQNNGMATVNSTASLFALQNRINSSYGTAVVLPDSCVKKAVSPDTVLGIAKTGGVAGASISVYKAY